MRLLLVLAAAAPLFGQCTYTVTPAQFNIAAGSGTGTVTGSSISVTAGTGCTWGATTNTSWLHIDSGQTGSGPGTVTWHADANTVTTARSGSLSVAGQTVSVTQAAQACTYTLTPPTIDFPVTGGPGSFQVQTTCTWSADPTQGWIHLPANGNASVTGNGTVNYTVDANGCATGRSGAITIATAEQLALTQDGSPANFAFSPTSESYPATVTNDRIAISTGAGCNWSAFSDVSWLSITSGQSGSGNGAIIIQVRANTSVARTGNLHINDGATVTLLPVTQAAPAPPPVQLTSVANGADYATNAVSPGEIVGLFGSNLGPATPAGLQVSAGGASIATTLAGVQVMFDNVAAALTYVSASQVNAVVPYEVANNSNGQTNVQVIYQGAASNTVTMPVVASTPAIFTLGSTGQGAGAILNQDLTVNGPNNRAARGSVVVIYCTGGGVTNPASADASIISATALPYLTQPVSVTIGGQNAAVQYAGGTPGTVAGLTQINAVVPAGVTPGTSVAVSVTIGNGTSPAGVTLAVQ
ncbi:MAG TPA: BACON domain-containing carbohydrate-binding protein [Bryobacteraceae bacterium]|nr:BACON domain-containing carbohydrate-binding protein [Bryobacteraceae bacterium]